MSERLHKYIKRYEQDGKIHIVMFTYFELNTKSLRLFHKDTYHPKLNFLRMFIDTNMSKNVSYIFEKYLVSK